MAVKQRLMFLQPYFCDSYKVNKDIYSWFTKNASEDGN